MTNRVLYEGSLAHFGAVRVVMQVDDQRDLTAYGPALPEIVVERLQDYDAMGEPNWERIAVQDPVYTKATIAALFHLLTTRDLKQDSVATAPSSSAS